MSNTFNPRPLTTEIGELISKIIIFRDYHRNVIRPKNMLEKQDIDDEVKRLEKFTTDTPFGFNPDSKWKHEVSTRKAKYHQEIKATKRSNQIYKHTLNIVQIFSFESSDQYNALQRFFKNPLFDGNVVCLILELVLDDKINHLYE